MTNPVDSLFTPFEMGELRLPNRIVMAPMTRYFAPNGVPSPGVAEYYARRAAADVGLIITEGVFVDHPTAGYASSVPHFYGDAALAAWSEVLAQVHGVGGKIMPQLWHAGVQPQPGDVADPNHPPLSASGLMGPDQRVGEPMTEAEIEAVINAFASAAQDADRLGFDGIELHGGHGYLLDSFFWHGTNIRTDRYGGDLAARAGFAAEIVRECRRRTRPGFPIVLRFSQWKNVDYDAKLASTPAALESFLAPLVDAGVDMFHCSTRRFWEPEFEGSDLNLAGWTRKLAGRPTITVGSIGLTQDLFASFAEENTPASGNLPLLLTMLDRGDFDLIAIGRALLVDPYWATKVREGRTDELRGFQRDGDAVLEMSSTDAGFRSSFEVSASCPARRRCP
jgi:2,4-dienoyl-CoA reductase-like NADH-dependent reductase (Old Yellow Enzyme family)